MGIYLSQYNNFFTALDIASQYLATHRHKTILMVFAYRVLDESTRFKNLAINSDAAAACILSTSDLVEWGDKENWLSAHTSAIEDTSGTIRSWINRVNDKFHNEGQLAKEMLMQGSLIQRAMETYSPIFGNDGEWKALVRSVVGDIVGYTKENTLSDGSGNTHIKLEIIVPTMNNAKFIEILLEGGQIQALGLTQTGTDNMKSKPEFPKMEITIPPGGIKKMIQDKIITIVNKINAHESINDSDKKFINAMPVPVYRVINVISVLGGAGIEKMSEHMALQQIEALIGKITHEITRYLAAYKRQKAVDILSDEDIKLVGKILLRARQNQDQINQIMIKISSDFKKQFNLVNHYINLEKDLREKSALWRGAHFSG